MNIIPDVEIGLDIELFTGHTGEQPHEVEIREEVARAVLADLEEEGATDLAAAARRLLASAPITFRRHRRLRHQVQMEVAA